MLLCISPSAVIYTTTCCYPPSLRSHRRIQHTLDAVILHHGIDKLRKQTRTSSSYSALSLQIQLDDNNAIPPTKTPRRKRKRRARETISGDDNNNSSIISILFQPVGSTKNNKRRKTVVEAIPPIYLLGIFVSISLLPAITSAMLVLFFGSYLALFSSLLEDEEYDYNDDVSLSLDDDNNEEKDEETREVKGVVVAAPSSIAFVGAVASAALLSPQGLVWNDEKNGFIIAATLIIIAALIKEIAKDTRQLEGEEIDTISERMERSAMSQWDDKLKETEDGPN